MKRFLVFAGHRHNPLGGWDDFRAGFDFVGDAISWAMPTSYEWWHVFDTERKTIVRRK
jgi:hypothetical protein